MFDTVSDLLTSHSSITALRGGDRGGALRQCTDRATIAANHVGKLQMLQKIAVIVTRLV